MKVVYLASAYSYKSRFKLISWLVRWYRARKVTKIAAQLTEKYKVALICPITVSHELAKHMEKPGTSFAAWKDVDLAFVKASDELWVVTCINGWKTSIGVQAEIKYAKRHKIPIKYIIEVNTLNERI